MFLYLIYAGADLPSGTKEPEGFLQKGSDRL
jgi:hypothetical protein